MPDPNQRNEDSNLEAPPKLAEALRRLERDVIAVPPEVDEAALSRARLHLSQIKQSQTGTEMRRSLSGEELALAARSETRGKKWSGHFAPDTLTPVVREQTSHLPWGKIVAWAVVLAVVAAVVLWLIPRSRSSRGAIPAIHSTVPLPPPR
jgi:hypothetical protein